MSKPRCIDLKAEFGDRFRIQYEETLPAGFVRDPWYAQIKCRCGGDELGAAVDSGRVQAAGTIRRLGCVRVTQNGDGGEVNAVFHRKDLDQVLAVMHPYRRKRVSEEHLRKMWAGGARFRAGAIQEGGLDPELGPSEAKPDKIPVQSRSGLLAAQGGLYVDTQMER